MHQEQSEVAAIPEPSPVLPGLQELLSEHNINNWDVLLIGDGSGSQWTHSYGWACVLIEQITLTPKVFYGGGSAGTNYISELEAYIRPMLWYSEGPGNECKKRRILTSNPLVQVHIITDCQTIAMQGNGLKRRNKNRPLWAFLEAIGAQGYHFHWYWMPREATALNRWTDRQSRLMRTTLARIGQALQGDLHNPDDLYNERFGLRTRT